MSSSLSYSPQRPVRMAKLNTIVEDDVELRGRSRATRPVSATSPASSMAETISSYYQSVRYSSEHLYNDLYDVSDDENNKNTPPKFQLRPASGATDASNRDSWITDMTDSAVPTRCQSMVIPSPRHWPTIQKLQHGQDFPLSPVEIPVSPLALSMLPPAPRAISRTPSLDGSMTSGETVSTAPSTPVVEGNPAATVDWNKVNVASSEYSSNYDASSLRAKSPSMEVDVRLSTGVQLPQEALSFLQHLSVEMPETAVITLDPEETESEPQAEMAEVPIKLSTKPSFESIPQSATSEYSISQLSIPSPGGFFAELDTSSGHTWSLQAESVPEPDSAVVEKFYNWDVQVEDVREQVIEVSEDALNGPTTALKMTPATARPLLKDYDDDYQLDLRKAAEMSMDRTSLWLNAQRDYLEAQLTEPKEAKAKEALPAEKEEEEKTQDIRPINGKKAVKFLDTVKANKEYRNGPSSTGSDPLFYHAWQQMSNLSSPTDSFTARQARYDALQARRSSVSTAHIDAVIGEFRVTENKRLAPQRPISIMPFEEPEETFEQRMFAQVERERQALEQVAPSMWVVEALRFLSGGRLLNSPAAAVLQNAPAVNKISQSTIRVLDLGGQPSCDWAWHCAREFPNVKTYTATSDPRISSANLRGPSNHRLTSVENLWQLPFPDNHFDAISARSLFTHLKMQRLAEEPELDQVDACLRECMRVLRPGGYLDFFVLDAEVVRGGPRGSAASVEFGYKLRQRGYEPNPTRSWLGRVRRAGFEDIKRAWMFLPMGALRENAGAAAEMPETPPPRASLFEERIKNMEAVRGPVGSAADVAEVSGLVGSWLWEQWIMKLEMEMGKPKGDLGATVGGVVEEGRKSGSGWRSLSGWCRKPLA